MGRRFYFFYSNLFVLAQSAEDYAEAAEHAAYEAFSSAMPMAMTVAISISDSALAAASSDYTDTVENAVSAAYTAVIYDDEKIINIDFEQEIISDLKTINNASKQISATDFILSPLWKNNSAPEKWQLLYHRFHQALIDLDQGFELWVRWLNERLEQIPLDSEFEEKSLEIPIEIKESGAKVTNAYITKLIKNNINPL